mmetsp:Transcript_177034/g.567816  ORF Transcript_177034/g.567816 Transcript_177034/m.567816 type:complete len:206 (-) Transcript_177034:777-1394(-)
MHGEEADETRIFAHRLDRQVHSLKQTDEEAVESVQLQECINRRPPDCLQHLRWHACAGCNGGRGGDSGAIAKEQRAEVQECQLGLLNLKRPLLRLPVGLGTPPLRDWADGTGGHLDVEQVVLILVLCILVIQLLHYPWLNSSRAARNQMLSQGLCHLIHKLPPLQLQQLEQEPVLDRPGGIRLRGLVELLQNSTNVCTLNRRTQC